MKTVKQPNLLSYLGSFTGVYIIVYALIALLFLNFQSLLPESKSLALDLYKPFRLFHVEAIIGQLLRAIAFALVFYPFYDIIFRSKTRARIILFISMWGIALICSVEPQPGSIEGIIYTTISFVEHASVIIATGLQMLIFIFIFTNWELIKNEENDSGSFLKLFPDSYKIKGYTIRFVFIHIITYWVVGSIFYEIAGYQDALESMEVFELWRPLENLSAVLLVFFGQIVRGTLIALLLYPFYQKYIKKKWGWVYLFWLLAGLTILGSPLFLTEFISFEGSFVDFFRSLIIGIPEIFSQIFVFSIAFFFWQKRIEKRR